MHKLFGAFFVACLSTGAAAQTPDDLHRSIEICAKHIVGTVQGGVLITRYTYEPTWEKLCQSVSQIQESEIAKEQAEIQRQRDIAAKPDYDFVDKFVRSH